MKKLALTIAIVLGITFGATAQAVYDSYGSTYYDTYNSYSNSSYGDRHMLDDYGDHHFVGSHFLNDEDEYDVLSGRSTIYGGGSSSDYYYNYSNNGYSGGGLFSRGMRAAGDNSPMLPIHGASTNQPASAPLGSGALLLIGFGAAYAMAKRKK